MKSCNNSKLISVTALMLASMATISMAMHQISGSPLDFVDAQQLYQSPNQLMTKNGYGLIQQRQQIANGRLIDAELSGSPLRSGSQPLRNLIRAQRSPNSGSQTLAMADQGPQFPLKLAAIEQQKLLEDEQALKRQLPDLIAQARTDKAIERALLKMLINASLRSILSNGGGSSSQVEAYGLSGADSALGGDGGESSMMESRPVLPFRMLENFSSGIDPLIGELDQSIQQSEQQYPPTVIDKRGYIKPCSFNAVSCAKNPFRRTSQQANRVVANA